MRLPRLTAPAVLALLLAAGPAPAQPFNYRYEFDLPGGTPSSTFTIPIGATTVDVAMYLVETDTASTLRNTGLFSTGVRLGYPAASPATVQAVSDITRNPAFDQQVGSSVDALGAVLLEQAFSNPTVMSPAADPNRILVGTFRLTRGSGNGTVTLAATVPGPNTTLTGTGGNLDSQVQSASATLTVVGVPEPGALALAGLAAAALAARRRRTLAVA